MTSQKNYTEVLIGGKVITLAGHETEEYLQKVATYLNHKINECKETEGYLRQNASMQSTLLALNIADDYFKTKKLSEALERDIEIKDKEIYDLKHNLISNQIKLENAEKLIEKLKEQTNDLQMVQFKLETEIKNKNK